METNAHALPLPETVAPKPSRKKGLGSWNPLTTASELGNLQLAWYYNWRPFPKVDPVPGVEFVPMFWSAADVTTENLKKVAASGATHVLGFNEPDMTGQSNMSAAECLRLWPRLMELPQKLGSPAPAVPAWLDRFLPEAKRRGFRVDFVCLHSYPDITKPGAAKEVERMLSEAYRRYRMPIWFTECGAADIRGWNPEQASKPTPQMAEEFLQEILELMERLPFVERYAWFSDRVGEEYELGTIYELKESRLTHMGEIYRDGVSGLSRVDISNLPSFKSTIR